MKLIYQCDYWWLGRKYAHLSWLTYCPLHKKSTWHCGTITPLIHLPHGETNG